MDKEQRIIEIRNELNRISKSKESGEKVNVWNLLKILGVDERIINNPNPNNLGMGLDFDSYIQSLEHANITIDDDGSLTMKTDIGNTYLVKEGKNVGGIKIALSVKNGEFHMGCAYKRDDFHAIKDNFDMMVVPYGNDYAVRTRTAGYSLESEYNKENQKYDTKGGGLCVISNYDKNGIERESSRVSYGNTPDIIVNSYSGFDLQTIWNQEYFARDWTCRHKELADLNPIGSFVDKKSAFFYGETLARRMDSVDKVQVSTWDSEKLSWDHKYCLSLTGEHDMSYVLNNSESYSSEEELESVREQRLEEGWYDRKIEQYRQGGGTTATTIANLLEQEKLKLEESKSRKL